MNVNKLILSIVAAGAAFSSSLDARADNGTWTMPYGGACNTGTCVNFTSLDTSSSGLAVQGLASGSGTGVYGHTVDGKGVYGVSSDGYGVYGNSGAGYGVAGESASLTGAGVYGINDNAGGIAVLGVVVDGTTGSAVVGINGGSNGYALLALGNLGVQSKISGPGGFSTSPYNGANTTTWAQISDVRLKKNVQSMQGTLDTLLQLRGVTFEWKEPERHGNQTGPQRGFIAQEVEKVLPDWVGEGADGFKFISIRGFEPMVVESLRELKAENAMLKGRVDALETARRPLKASLLDEGGLGVAIVAAALIVSRRKRSP